MHASTIRGGWASAVGPAIGVAIVLCASAVLGDEVELLSGIIVRGVVVDESGESISIRMTVGGSRHEMTIERHKIHSITRNGNRQVINEKPAQRTTPRPTPTPTPRPTPAASVPGGTTRTEAEVMALLNQAGRTPPDWWDSVNLDYPKTLDLTFKQSNEGWNPNKYISQYIVSVTRPNPSRWKPTVKLLHHALRVNRGNSLALRRTVEALAQMYGDYLEDYARAAFWWGKVANLGGGLNANQAVTLADCYRRLGCIPLAKRQASKMSRDTTGTGTLIKLWSDMGDLDKALSLAEGRARAGHPDIAYFAAGNACRYHGQYDKAITYYEKVLSARKGSGHINVQKKYARHNLDAVKAFEALDLTRIPDGTYTGDGYGYRGPITVHVTVRGGRITNCKVTQQGRKEDWPGSSLISIPRQIIEKQGVKGVDAVTGATTTSQGIISGAAKALATGTR